MGNTCAKENGNPKQRDRGSLTKEEPPQDRDAHAAKAPAKRAEPAPRKAAPRKGAPQKADPPKTKTNKRGDASRFQSVYHADDPNLDKSKENANADIRLVNIFSKGVEVTEHFEAPSYPKTQQQTVLIREAAASNFLFEDLNDSARNMIIEAMDPIEVPKGIEIITQGETGDYFYVIERGSVAFFVNDARVGEASSGDSFGELALMYDCPRAATCTAESKSVKLWRVDQTLFKQILASSKMKEVSNDIGILKKVSFLKDLDSRYLNTIAHALTRKEYSAGHQIVKKGETGHTFYIIQSGKVKVSEIGLGESQFDDIELSSGEFFGERALITGDVRAANITALTDIVLMEMDGFDFKELLGPVEDLMTESRKKEYLIGVPIIARAKPTEEEIADLVSTKHLRSTSFAKDRVIGREGERISNPCIYIIVEGSVSAGEKTLLSGDYFCDDSMLGSPPTYSHTFISLGDGDKPTKCGQISLQSFVAVFGGRSRLMGSVGSSRRVMQPIDKKASFAGEVNLDTLEKLKILGSGTFGKVWLVRHKESNNAWAMKVQRKIDILTYKQTDGVIREKNIMAKLDHPFIIRLISAFQDDLDLYMVLKMYPGGELFSLLHQKSGSGINEKAAKFYSSIILEALDFMHLKNILYRDLKPENVLIDGDGYCVIIDMGFAKVVEDKTYTLCGTPLYIAPEVILSRGHDKAADIWSLGVLIFEMVYGSTPFYKGNVDQMALFKAIVRGKVEFPNMRKVALNDLVERMLKRRAPFRLGCLKNGAQDIRDHDWFADVRFDAIRSKSVKAPWKPKMKDPFDTRNFDNWSHLEQEEKGRRKLTRDEQAKFAGF